MFNLVGKRYLFLIISLIVIVPGTLSLIFKGLNVGIDFTQGTNLEFRPQQNLSIADVRRIVQPFNLSSLEVVTGDDPSVKGPQNMWVRLNRQVDTNTQNFIKNCVQGQFSQASVAIDDLKLNPLTGTGAAKTVTVIALAFKGSSAPSTDTINKLLASLPDTSNPALGPSTASPKNAGACPNVNATATPGTTPTQSASSTPTTTPTAKPSNSPTATSTQSASSTPTATPTQKPTSTPTASSSPIVGVSPTPTSTVSNPSTLPVSIDKIYQGKVTETVTLLTLTFIDQNTLLKLQSTFANSGNFIYILDNATVSGSVAAETTRNAVLAVIAASVFILLYIWFAFRKVAKPWRFGTCAIMALLHDVLVVLGVFSILGWLLHIQIDALFITALLTVVGFSVHDTIVVFDRIRENLSRRTSETFEQVVNASLVQTMARSLNTSLTVLLTLSALTLFGGTTIRTFTLTLLVGIFSGTYSSIFNASMLLVIWERGELGMWRFRRDRTPDGRESRELVRTR